ncbi:hypothetical protein J6524_01320 [Bradyrhizobium sp. WSM 1738]|uniref:hypothetical protein n=1 Tax=Bradyrhizobium hereditatis TaxID=2821405 RepID=UPI001CE2C67E|nr:hypothetical protein [Bradyrhizobium hereditatis]MCA6113571.1 hypothetical protein [Bradyrhizobium hereditatis]
MDLHLSGFVESEKMSTPPPLPPGSDRDVLSIRIATLALAACNGAIWVYIFPFVYAHANRKGDGFDMLPVMPFTIIFFALTLPSAARAIGGRGLGVALGLGLGATALNAIIFLALLSSYAAASR